MICTTIDTRNINTFAAETVIKPYHNAVSEYIAAGSPITPIYQLISLAESADKKVRRRIAENLNSPLSLLFVLAKDEDPDVRASVTTNPGATFRLIERLITDHSADVRFTLAENHKLHKDLLIKLCLDENPYVANRAQLTLARLQSSQVAVAA